ncbi:hypothetical protein CK222_25905 [Mesorhizobium sp. WSM3866]|uniref:HipA N-terminal domain-containing protein n=1 Tax=Rhizobium loti TaxID=381 RepID=UPI000BAF7355|nr:hypothetical protein CK221_02645 [Mesorhizobium sp. WSM3868]PBB40809.1 hypothetical protein CK222_25905 [Mesorhizobium sp. WSM3866]PBB58875.1 hypothetical protein CK217_27380 [Mesorhizobium loti]PBB80091.1 hypothetical protein CK218_15735 [Mesorhizobium sp. WSM3879]PBB85070.1 hypothetical protein CK216_19445 [Mesorhizobium sp. WSM3876]
MPASIRLYGLPVGVLDVARDGDLSFRYEPGWLERTQLPRHPLSLALPLSPDPYNHDRAGPFFDGLLPDSQQRARLWLSAGRCHRRLRAALPARPRLPGRGHRYAARR